ncbi:hypothetical protein V3O24_05310 [Methylobacter sp. Wu8]
MGRKNDEAALSTVDITATGETHFMVFEGLPAHQKDVFAFPLNAAL